QVDTDIRNLILTGLHTCSLPNSDSAPLSTARKANAVEPNVTARDVTTGSFPSSRKVHVAGRRHGDIRVAMREIDLEPSANEPALVRESGVLGMRDRLVTRW